MLGNTEKPHHFPEKGRRHKITAKRLNAGNDAISRLIEENRRLESRLRLLEKKISSTENIGFRFIRITTQNQFDSASGKNRWWYGCEEVYKVAGAGYDFWFSRNGGFVGRAYNMIENMNDGLTVEGHGVNIGGDDYPDGFSVMPVAIGVIVPAWLISVNKQVGNRLPSKSFLEAWFCVPNTDDGTCES